jgi:hypothetical protein
MCQNTDILFTRGFFIATLISMFFLPENAHASQGAELAKEMFQKIQTVSTEQDMKTLLQTATQDKSRLSSEDRIEYSEYLYYVLATSTGADQEKVSWNAMLLIPGGISEQEIRAGRARLLSSNDPAVRKCGENMDLTGDVKLPNGQTGQDISVFDLALHDPKVPQDRLIAALFKLAPVESAQWFADHAGLPPNERAGLESDLQNAWKVHRALNEPNAAKETKAVLDDSVKNPLLDRWLHSPSWILRAMANGLLQKRTELQTSDLQKAMQPVQVPTGLQVSSTEGQPDSK